MLGLATQSLGSIITCYFVVSIEYEKEGNFTNTEPIALNYIDGLSSISCINVVL